MRVIYTAQVSEEARRINICVRLSPVFGTERPVPPCLMLFFILYMILYVYENQAKTNGRKKRKRKKLYISTVREGISINTHYIDLLFIVFSIFNTMYVTFSM
jgi:hypothetical protein